jgi:hypothetical protein
MIEVSRYRFDQNERISNAQPYGEVMCKDNKSVAHALCEAIEFELGYGGKVKEVSETRLVIQTNILSKIDHIVFEGTKEDMLEILHFVRIYLTANNDRDFDDFFKQVEGTYLGEKLRLPLYLTTLGVLLVGSGRAHRGAVLYLCESESDVELFSTKDFQTLLQLIQLKVDENAGIEDLRLLAA